jgi:hypothetical protein
MPPLKTHFLARYVIWLIRGGLLLSSVLSSLPAWRFVDPLPVLAYREDEAEEDGSSLEALVDGTPPPPPAESGPRSGERPA